MNLWAKSLGRLSFLAVALFFFSCEDENSFLGFRNPVPRFNVSYVDIPLTSNVQLIDSIITDNKGGSGALLLGKYTDNSFGEVTAQSYLQIYPSAATAIPETALFDSITFSVRFNFYGYGFTGKQTHKFSIHELTEALDLSSTTRYYYNSAGIAMQPTPMATSMVSVDADSLKKQLAITANKQDTLVARARLSDDFGKRIFALLQAYNFQGDDPALVKAQFDEFLRRIHGVGLVPNEGDGVLGFKIFNNLSAVTLHYRTVANSVVNDTLTRVLQFSTPSFTKISVNRTSPLAGLLAYQSSGDFSRDGLRYVESGAPVITKLSLQNFYSFADTVGNVLVNEAALVIDGVESPLNTPPITDLGLKVMNENNQFTNYSVEADKTAMKLYTLGQTNQFGTLLVDGKHYVVKSDLPSSTAQIATLNYSSGKYSGYLTSFFQQLLKYRNDGEGVNETRVKYLGLFAFSPSITSSVTRSVFPGANVKLRIYYTKPTITINP